MGGQRFLPQTPDMDKIDLLVPIGLDDGLVPVPQPPHEVIGHQRARGRGHQRRSAHLVHFHAAFGRVPRRQIGQLQVNLLIR